MLNVLELPRYIPRHDLAVAQVTVYLPYLTMAYGTAISGRVDRYWDSTVHTPPLGTSTEKMRALLQYMNPSDHPTLSSLYSRFNCDINV